MAEWPIPDQARMDEIFESVKNWGRWGAEDEAGALNLITPEVRRAASACVRHGRAVSLFAALLLAGGPEVRLGAAVQSPRRGGGVPTARHGLDGAAGFGAHAGSTVLVTRFKRSALR